MAVPCITRRQHQPSLQCLSRSDLDSSCCCELLRGLQQCWHLLMGILQETKRPLQRSATLTGGSRGLS